MKEASKSKNDLDQSPVSSPDSNKQVTTNKGRVSPPSPRERVDRQIRYLGLVIEKDAEYEEYPEILNDGI